jgi:CheY-like chemotaxis protein
VTRLDGAFWLLEVIDSGAGMDAHTTQRIFDPFFTTKPDRHGLGLSAVHGIVRRFGGEIQVVSVVGKGTTIAVRLPVVVGVEPERKRTTSKQPPLPTLRGLRILVADDEPSVRATVKRLLDRRGAEVVVAADGAEARDRLAEGEYHLVLFDVMMPELTGYQLLPIARRLQPAAKVMLMSGYSEHTRRVGRDEEPDSFLEKPFTAKVLDHAIDDVLGRR